MFGQFDGRRKDSGRMVLIVMLIASRHQLFGLQISPMLIRDCSV